MSAAVGTKRPKHASDATAAQRMAQMQQQLEKEGYFVCSQCGWWDELYDECKGCHQVLCETCSDDSNYTICTTRTCYRSFCENCRDAHMKPCAAGSKKCLHWRCLQCKAPDPCGHVMCKEHQGHGETCRFCTAQRALVVMGILRRPTWRQWVSKDMANLIGKWVWTQRFN